MTEIYVTKLGLGNEEKKAVVFCAFVFPCNLYNPINPGSENSKWLSYAFVFPCNLYNPINPGSDNSKWLSHAFVFPCNLFNPMNHS